MPRRPQFPTYDLGHPLALVNTRAVAITVDSTISSATDITLDVATNFIRVFAKTQGIYIKGSSGVSATSWDWFVPANGLVDIVIPDDVTAISVIEESASAKIIMAEYA